MSTPVPARHDPVQPAGSEVPPRLLPRLAAEAFGSFFLALAGLGVPLFTIPQSSPMPAALAAGLAVTAAMLAFGHVSGGHFNPAITAGHLMAGRIRVGAAGAYAAAQLAGGLLAALALFGILRTLPGIADSRTAFDTVTAGFGEHSIIQAPLAAVLLLEMIGAAIITAVFLATARRDSSSPSAAPVAVGLSFAVLLQLGLSVGNLPFNPARAAASAVFSSGWALEQLWVFVAAPLIGAVIAGLAFRSFNAAASTTGEALAGRDSSEAAAVERADEDPIDESVATGETAPKPAGKDSQTAASEAQEFFEGKR
ncbi:major intrinsic family protein [Pseudarthrobacter siccitolerans]|uniref:Major intrinsic family protein n=1 Tax=Pseudarthrobacter siccitolerans TaxID=861266 RepID=A0A024H0Y0_9MICC|nr:aquaporin [Pseudarthrobacter siccitolerans]CCQ45678.1 major intrinsic family protein [Pseudarthrobacter siccitolerans]